MHHRLLDQRSLSLHCLMVDKIKQDPGLYLKIGQTIHRWKRIVSQDSTPFFLLERVLPPKRPPITVQKGHTLLVGSVSLTRPKRTMEYFLRGSLIDSKADIYQ